MVSFFQHNQYHFYTADEHTMVVIANAELLEQSSSLFGEVFRSLPRRDTLYLACLLHDIAKPSHIGKHELKGIPIAKRVLHRHISCSSPFVDGTSCIPAQFKRSADHC
jgi:UTP:GlnB (protein PII) uridylyltransferase